MADLFDTDAISEVQRKKPSQRYAAWLRTVPREEQFTSAVSVGELYEGAYRSRERELHLANISERVLKALTPLPFDVATARVFGKIQAHLEDEGTPLADADAQIAATAMYHGLELVTGNLRRLEQVPGLKINSILADSRRRG
jgi:predicted nucleic acid-binding protein